MEPDGQLPSHFEQVDRLTGVGIDLETVRDLVSGLPDQVE